MDGMIQKYRLLLVNPNGNPAVTEQVQRSAERVLGPDWSARTVNPAQSPLSIQTLADRTMAEPFAIDLLSSHQGYDAYVMACFDDIAVQAGRRLLKSPVVDPVAASVAIARHCAPQFTIVTTVQTMVPGICTLLDAMGATGQCNVRAAGISVADAAAGLPEAMERLDRTVEAARNVDGAGAIILGSAGLTGQAAKLQQRYGLPVIDCIEAAVLMAVSTARCVGLRPATADAH
jgi:allantoin racemase